MSFCCVILVIISIDGLVLSLIFCFFPSIVPNSTLPYCVIGTGMVSLHSRIVRFNKSGLLDRNRMAHNIISWHFKSEFISEIVSRSISIQRFRSLNVENPFSIETKSEICLGFRVQGICFLAVSVLLLIDMVQTTPATRVPTESWSSFGASRSFVFNNRLCITTVPSWYC